MKVIAIHCDNGPELLSEFFVSWCRENGMIVSFNGWFRDECLNVHLFWTTEDARKNLEALRLDYNAVRPHSALGALTPQEYTARSWSGVG